MEPGSPESLTRLGRILAGDPVPRSCHLLSGSPRAGCPDFFGCWLSRPQSESCVPLEKVYYIQSLYIYPVCMSIHTKYIGNGANICLSKSLRRSPNS